MVTTYKTPTQRPHPRQSNIPKTRQTLQMRATKMQHHLLWLIVSWVEN